jgi:peptidoglycan lytic transglycosylase G
MGRALRWLAGLAALLVVAAVAGGLYVHDLYTRAGDLAEATTVVVPKGESVRQIGHRLADAGVIRSPWLFSLSARLNDVDTKVRAGEYLFPAAVSIEGTIELLRAGQVVQRALTIPEGRTSGEIALIVAAADGLEGALASVPDEGTVLPETYHYVYGDSRPEMIERMQKAMEETVNQMWETRADGLPFATPEEAVILASIVEKETGVVAERPRVAAVFINRLRRGIPLQADPTVVYAINGTAGPLGRSLTRDDLKTPSPFNTYVNTGLPPQPIANPGRDAIAAVLKPLETDELFFVADGSGGHRFAATLAEHNRNVARWRAYLKRDAGH